MVERTNRLIPILFAGIMLSMVPLVMITSVPGPVPTRSSARCGRLWGPTERQIALMSTATACMASLVPERSPLNSHQGGVKSR